MVFSVQRSRERERERKMIAAPRERRVTLWETRSFAAYYSMDGVERERARRGIHHEEPAIRSGREAARSSRAR